MEPLGLGLDAHGRGDWRKGKTISIRERKISCCCADHREYLNQELCGGVRGSNMDFNSIIHTLTVAHSGNASVEERRAEVHLFEELRNHVNIQVVVQLGVELTTKRELLVQGQLMGFGVLQHVAGNRWDELRPEDREAMLGLCFNMLESFCDENLDAAGGSRGTIVYALRSKCAVLFAIVIKRHGAAYVSESLRRLIQDEAKYKQDTRKKGLSSYHSLVCLVFRYLVDEVYQFAGDMQGDHAREMLVCMATWIPEILKFTVNVIEVDYATYTSTDDEMEKKNSYFAVKTALESGSLYAEVAPASSMYSCGLIKAAGFFISQNMEELRHICCDILKHVGSRKQTSDESLEDFTHAMQEVGVFLTSLAAQLLGNNAEERLSFEGEDEEFGLDVVDAMVDLGKTHLLVAFGDDASRYSFLEHMLGFAKHPYLPLSGKALGLWYKLLQDAASTASLKINHEKSTLPSEAVLVLMQLAAQQLQHRHTRVPHLDDEIPLFFDDFEEYKDFIVGYRQKLSAIVRFSAATLPEQALQATVSSLTDAVSLAAKGHATKDSIENARSSLEAAAVFSESTVKAVWEAVNAGNLPEEIRLVRKQTFCANLEPIYNTVIQLRVSDPRLLNSQARALGSFARLLSLRPDLAKDAISNLLSILVTCIPLTPGEHETPPPLPSSVWREAAQARSAVATVLLDYAKFCQQGFLPLIEEVAGTVTQLYDSGRIRPGEKNTIIEGLLAASLSGTTQLQETVINWSMHSIKTSWTSHVVQDSISNIDQFISTYLPVYMEGNEVRVGGTKERYMLYHQIHMIERTLRRLTTESARAILSKHMEWIIPFCLQYLSSLNALSTQQGRALIGAASAALDMSPQERAHYLRRGPVRLLPLPGDSDAGDYSTVGGATVSSARAWIRHSVEFLCHSLGLLPSVVPESLTLVSGLKENSATSIFSSIDTIDHKQLRIILRHVTIPSIKYCPPESISIWVLPSLSLLAPHMKNRLAVAWKSLNVEATNQLDFGYDRGTAPQATEEDVINDRLVRELSQEYADLLKELASRQIEHDANTKTPLLQSFLVSDTAAGIAAAGAALEGMLRPDEAAYKFAAFCRALVNLAPTDAALYNYVGSEVLYNTISSLSLEVMASHQAEILGMIRAIIIQQIDDPQSQVHSILSMLPGVGPPQITSFFTLIKSTGSEKEQRNHVKQFLLSTAGKGSFTALARWKPPGAASAVQGTKNRASRIQKTSQQEESDDALQGEITRHLFG